MLFLQSTRLGIALITRPNTRWFLVYNSTYKAAYTLS